MLTFCRPKIIDTFCVMGHHIQPSTLKKMIFLNTIPPNNFHHCRPSHASSPKSLGEVHSDDVGDCSDPSVLLCTLKNNFFDSKATELDGWNCTRKNPSANNKSFFQNKNIILNSLHPLHPNPIMSDENFTVDCCIWCHCMASLNGSKSALFACCSMSPNPSHLLPSSIYSLLIVESLPHLW